MKLFVALRVLERSNELTLGIRTGLANQRHCAAPTPRGRPAHPGPGSLRHADTLVVTDGTYYTRLRNSTAKIDACTLI
jgi:hypothetical protein